MLKGLTAAILCFHILASLAQTGEASRIFIKGKITNISLDPVSYAHLVVKSRNEGWVGDYNGNFKIAVYPGDTLIISAISFLHAVVPVTFSTLSPDYFMDVILQADTVYLKELVVHPYPSTFKQLKEEFLKVEIEDPLANLDLHLPSPAELKRLAQDQTYEPGQIRIYSGSGPISLLYGQFSKEARSGKNYETALKWEKASLRYNRKVVSRITGLKNEDEITRFIEFCALQIKFILESTDYELYAAIMNCYGEYCRSEDRSVNPVE